MSLDPVDRITLGSYACDASSGRVSLSASLRRIAGLPETDSISIDEFLAVVDPADRPQVAATMVPAPVGPGPRAILCRFVRPSGDVRWTILRPTIERQESGRAARIVGLVFDATPSYDACRAIVALSGVPDFEREYRRSPVPLLLADERRMIDANQAACDLLAISCADLADMPIDAGPVASVGLSTLVPRVLRGDTVVPHVVRIRRADRRTQNVLATVDAVSDRSRALVALIDASVRFDPVHGAGIDDELRDLADRAAEGVAFTEDGIVLYANDRFADLVAAEAPALRGRALADCFEEDVAATVRQRLLTGALDPYIVRVRRPDGVVAAVELMPRLIRRGDRTIRMETVRDLSERERADRAFEALRQSREQFRHLAEVHGDGVVLIEDAGIVHANSKFATMLGYDLGDIVGRPWASVSPVAPTAEADDEGDDEPTLTTAWRRDGSVVPIEILRRRVEADGHVYGIVTVRDVTRRERAEALRRALVAGTAAVTGPEFFRAVVKHLAAALGVAHAFVAEYAGAPPNRVVALSVWKDGHYATAFDRPLAGTPCDLVMQAGLQCFGRDVQSLFPSDALMRELGAIGYFGAPLFDGGGRPVGVLAVVDRRPLERTDAAEDVLAVFAARASVERQRMRGEEAIRSLNADLERRVADRTAALEEANRELEAFSYSVSHDLQAPLRHIGGFVDLLLADQHSTFGAAAIEHAAEIGTAVDRMRVLIDTLLEFSRLGRVAIRASAVDLTPIVEAVADEIGKGAQDRVIHWRIDPLPPVWGDPVLLRQVVANLLGNAVKYTRTREAATIAVGPGESTVDGDVVIVVRDNGVGFDMKAAGRLFGVFQRLHPASRFDGTGIGLANVHRIVTRHGGRVWAESRVDEGATFFVALPAPSRAGVQTQ